MAQTKAQLIDGKSATIEFSGGSSSAPAITFTGDTNTGIYSPGADQVAISTGGSGRLFVDSSGRVGIGTTNPGTTLDVNGGCQITGSASGYSGGEVRLGATTADLQHSISTQSSGTPIMFFDHRGTGNTGIFAWRVGSGGASERMRIDSSGRLLVGTSSARTTFFNGILAPSVQIEGTGGARMLSIFSNNNDGGVLILGRQGGSTPGGNTLVANNDEIGIISFQASDGTDPTECARIQALIDGAPGNNDTPGRLVFSTTADGASSPTERMRITQAGKICMGNSASSQPETLQVYSLDSANGYCILANVAGTGYRTHIRFENGNGMIGGITTSGTTTTYNTVSDYRLKENVTPAINGITRLLQLNPYRFNFKADRNVVIDGFIAHEVQAVVPECVTGEKDAVDDNGNPVYQGIDQSKLVPLLTAALQEAIGEIEKLKARVVALESKP